MARVRVMIGVRFLLLGFSHFKLSTDTFCVNNNNNNNNGFV